MTRALLLSLALLFPLSAEASPRQVCSDIATVNKHLESDGEVKLIAYLDGDIVKILYGNSQSGKWTLVFVSLDGLACTARHGGGLITAKGWEA